MSLRPPSRLRHCVKHRYAPNHQGWQNHWQDWILAFFDLACPRALDRPFGHRLSGPDQVADSDHFCLRFAFNASRATQPKTPKKQVFSFSKDSVCLFVSVMACSETHQRSCLRLLSYPLSRTREGWRAAIIRGDFSARQSQARRGTRLMKSLSWYARNAV